MNREVGKNARRTERRQPTAGTLDDQGLALQPQALIGPVEHVEVDIDSCLPGRNMRRDRRREGVRVHVAIAGAHIRCREKQQSVVIAEPLRRERATRGHRLHRGHADTAGGQTAA